MLARLSSSRLSRRIILLYSLRPDGFYHLIPNTVTHILTCRRLSLAKRITRSGTSYDRAIALLREHDLVQTMRQSGANELAKRIESHLVNVYRISEIHQEAMHTFDDGVTIKRSDEDIEETNDGDRMHLDE